MLTALVLVLSAAALLETAVFVADRRRPRYVGRHRAGW
mgnify:CR=1 FL=1